MPFGVLASELSREAVDEVVANGRQPRRRDSRLPAHVMVYFVLALGLWSGDDCEQVMPQLTDRWGPGRLGCRPTGPQPRAGPRRPVSGWGPGCWRICTSGWRSRARRSSPRGLGRDVAAGGRGQHRGRLARHPRQRRLLRSAWWHRHAGAVPSGQGRDSACLAGGVNDVRRWLKAPTGSSGTLHAVDLSGCPRDSEGCRPRFVSGLMGPADPVSCPGLSGRSV